MCRTAASGSYGFVGRPRESGVSIKETWTIEEDNPWRASLAEGQAVRMIASHSKRTTSATGGQKS
jgi:hypothetical protein